MVRFGQTGRACEPDPTPALQRLVELAETPTVRCTAARLDEDFLALLGAPFEIGVEGLQNAAL